MDDLAVVPAWVAPAHQQVVELNYMAHELATTVGAPHGAGQLAAVGWVTVQCAAPVTRRPVRATWELARAESWVALCSAAHDCSPTAGDWERLAVAPLPAVVVEDMDDYARRVANPGVAAGSDR